MLTNLVVGALGAVLGIVAVGICITYALDHT